MRTLPSSVQALLATGTCEPINFIKVYWSDVPVLYADKTYKDLNIKGKIITLSTIEDVRDLNKSVYDVSFTITLNDTDNEFKTLITNRDITNVKVELYQWFAEVPFGDAFKIFEGVIHSPITYSDGANNITFTVLNKLDDLEFGFSAEEGQFDYLPANMVGKAWPIVFGSVSSVPLLQFHEQPSAILGSGMGELDEEQWKADLTKLQAQVTKGEQAVRDAFLLGMQEAYKSTLYDDPFNFGSFGVTNDPEQTKSHRQASQQAFAQAEQYAIDLIEIKKTQKEQIDLHELQQSLKRITVDIFQSNMPSGQKFNFRLNDVFKLGIVHGSQITFDDKYSLRENINTLKPLNRARITSTLQTEESATRTPKFTWIDAGTKIYVLDYPISFIVSTTPVSISALKAKQSGVYMPLPREYYTISYPTFHSQITGNNFTPTIVTLAGPLTAKNDPSINVNWDNDQIYADIIGSPAVSSNVVDIMIYIITTYTTLTYDATSFNHVKTLVAKYVANFAIQDRINTIELLRQIAYQARIAIWTNDNKFYIRYLPEQLSPVDTLTLDDIESLSLTMTTDTTEDLVTKYTATWKPSLDFPEPFKIIYRYNIQKYGTKEETHDFFIYNNVEPVRKSAEYWLIKQGNAWKRLQFNVNISKMNLEAFDPVLIDFQLPWICAVPVVGVIERATLDTTNNKIALEVWIPVRFGESLPYVFAAPKDVVQIYPTQGDQQVKTGNPLQGSTGSVVNRSRVLGTGGNGINYLTSTSKFFDNAAGRNLPINDASDGSRDFGSVGTFLVNSNVAAPGFGRPGTLSKFNDKIDYHVQPFTQEGAPAVAAGSFGGIVVDYVGAGIYLCDVYTKGNTHPPISARVVHFGFVSSDDVMGAGTVIEVSRLQQVKGEGVKYFTVPPMWVRGIDDESGT